MEKFTEAVNDLVEFDFKNRKNAKSLGPFKVSGYDNVWSIPIIITLGVIGMYLLALTAFFVVSGRFNPSMRSVKVIGAFLLFYIIMYIRKHIINLKSAKEERIKRDKLRAERQKYVDACTVAAKECGLETYPWWEKFDPWQNFTRRFNDKCVWSHLPRNPFTQKDGKMYFDKFICGGECISGGELIDKYINRTTKDWKLFYKCFLGEQISRDTNYTIANVGSYTSYDASYTYEVWQADKNAAEKTKEYERELDSYESVSNAFWNRDFSTDKEMYIKGYGTTLEYIDKREKRNKKISDYKNSLGEYKTYVADAGLYSIYINFYGYGIFDEDFGRIIGMLISDTDISMKIKTTEAEPSDSCEIVEAKKEDMYTGHISSNEVLQHIAFYTNGEFDFTIDKPDYVTDDEWGLWVYSHYTDKFLFIDESYNWRHWKNN